MTDLVRQMEFTLLRLETRLGELLSARQQAVHKRVQVQLIPPHMLERILIIVSLGLTENFDLIKGLQDVILLRVHSNRSSCYQEGNFVILIHSLR